MLSVQRIQQESMNPWFWLVINIPQGSCFVIDTKVTIDSKFCWVGNGEGVGEARQDREKHTNLPSQTKASQVSLTLRGTLT